MRARDSQRSRVYLADNALKPFATMLPGVKDVEEFVADLWASKRFQAAFPSALIRGVPRVGDGRGRRKACGNAVEIKIPLWARRSDVVIHELAHTLTRRKFGYGSDIASHGWQFCETYLTLTRIVLGGIAERALRDAMKKHRVRFKPKRKMSDEQRAACAARLSVYRANHPELLAAKEAE
jgi:putative metallohydrolase (TIGR04338 family)